MSVLVDGAAYFSALRRSMLQAEHSILIIGWDIHSGVRLVGPDGAEDDAPERLKDFLVHLAGEKPDLKIHLLLWDYAILYTLEREPVPKVKLDWTTPAQISFCLDNTLPAGASHHQKIVVVDDAVAFCGGLDLTANRWDTPEHKIGNTSRRSPSGETYRPFHDVQLMVDSTAARALGELARARWQNAGVPAVAEMPIHKPESDPWPSSIEPDFRDVDIGIARTAAAHDGRPEIREIEALFLESVKTADRIIYCENQFFTANAIGQALAQRLAENPKLELVLVGPNVHQTWLEERSMNTGRRRFMERFEDMGVSDRVRLYHPAIPDDDSGQGTMVHAKVMIVDDVLLHVGSANLNNRSMGLDTECDLAVEARNGRERDAIAAIRTRLLSEHLGKSAEDVDAAIRSHGSFIAAIEYLSDGTRTLKPVDLDGAPDDKLALAVQSLADWERPVDATEFIGNIFSGEMFGTAKTPPDA